MTTLQDLGQNPLLGRVFSAAMRVDSCIIGIPEIHLWGCWELKKKHRFQNVIFKIIKIQHQPQNHQNPALSSKSSKATFFVGCCGNPFKKARIFRGFKRGFGTTWYANKNSKRKMPLLLGGGFSIIKLGDWLKTQNMYWRIRWTSPLVKRHNFEATLELFWYLQCQYKLKSRGFPY